MVFLPLPPESPFSRAIFKLIRPHIPRERWPADSVEATFVASGDGLWLGAEFDGFPAAYRDLAAKLVREGGVDLVLQSPAAALAVAVSRCKRWRDAAMYAFLPLLFAIPLAGSFSDPAMRLASLVCFLDLLALTLLHAVLIRRRAAMAAARFIAQIPAPGLKISLGNRRPPIRGGGDIPLV